ncbi:hypothetical protein [Roseivirga sp.]|uniref:hypothetical protein n=1 Tax=Roseivirga sp. TaxID=1964215 RepID=UPI002B26F3B5|nr:hypothetical protein [Roseivirga sp.]
MRIKKLRGHHRIWKEIEAWKNENLQLDTESLQSSQRDHTKIWVSPYCDYTMLNSEYPQPKGKTRQKILNGLIDIYNEWKKQLDELGEPYYLKIWLNDPYFSQSQVVCAIGDFLHFYDRTFFKPDQEYATHAKPRIKNLPAGFNWECRLDEMHLTSNDLGQPEDYFDEEDYLIEKNRFEAQIKRPHRKTVSKSEDGEITEYYSFKLGHAWLGSKD